MADSYIQTNASGTMFAGPDALLIWYNGLKQ